MKIIKYILLFVVIGGGLFLGYKIFNFNLFDNDLEFVEKIPVNNRNYSVLILKFPSSSTVNGAIQVHLIQDNSGESKFYKNYDRYNKLAYAKILGQNILEIGLQDTTRSNSRIDTISVVLPKKY